MLYAFIFIRVLIIFVNVQVQAKPATLPGKLPREEKY